MVILVHRALVQGLEASGIAMHPPDALELPSAALRVGLQFNVETELVPSLGNTPSL